MTTYVCFRSNTGIYHIAMLAQENNEKNKPDIFGRNNDRTLCGKELFTQDRESIWETMSTGVTFSSEPPKNARLCKTCEYQSKTGQ